MKRLLKSFLKRSVFQWIMLWVAATVIILPLPVRADDALGPAGDRKDEPVKLDTVVVTAGRVAENKADIPTHITVVTEEQIERSSARDLGGLLAEQGFMVREYPNSLISVNVRGFQTETHGNDLDSHVLVLINGRRAGTGNLAKIMVDNVERVEIIRGPGSVQYGSSAMGGVVNVITKQGQGKPFVSVEGVLGSWNYEKIAAGAAGQFGDVDFSFHISNESQDDYTTAAGDTYYNTGFDSKKRISINAGWTFAPENRIGVTYTGFQGEGIGSPGYLSQNDPDDTADQGINTVDLVYNGRSTKGFLQWQLRYFTGKDTYETFEPENYGSEHAYFRDTEQQGAQTQVSARWPHVLVTTGVDWTHYAITNTYTVDGGENTYDNPAVFLMAKAHFLKEKLIFSAAGRHDGYEVESDDGRSTNEANGTASFGAVYKFSEALSVRSNYAEAFKMPTADELYMYDDYSAWGYGIWSGNPDLKPEESRTWEIGMDISRQSLQGGLTYFYTRYEDKIYYAYDEAEGITRYENVEGATIAGMEGTLQFDIGAFYDWPCELAPYTSFVYLTEHKDEQTGRDLQYTPQWTASYGLRFAVPDSGWSSRLNVACTGKQDIIDYEGTGRTSLDSYTLADLTISKRLFSSDRFGSIQLKADITNLFDEDYAMVQGYPCPGRTFYLGVNYIY
jgi:vitamin B12 transporter